MRNASDSFPRRLVVPPPLGRPGESDAAIGLAAPAGFMEAARVRRNAKILARRGHPVVRAENVLSRHGYFAGLDVERLRGLHGLLLQKKLRAVLMTRGGYGCMRLLDHLDYALFRRKKTLLAGFSDLTALFTAMLRHAGLASLYSPMLLNMGRLHGDDEKRFWLALEEGKFPPLRFAPSQVISHGAASGRLLGGCLTLCAALAGTRHDVSWRGCVVFLEDTHDAPYAVDRSLMHLRLAGKFEGARAVVLGRMTPDPYERRKSLSFRRVYREVLGNLGIPVVMDMPFGHGPRKAALPFGGRARLDTRAGVMEMGW